MWDYVHAFYYFSDDTKRKDVLADLGEPRPEQDTVEMLRDYYRQLDSAQPRDALMQLAMRTQLPEEFLFMTDRFSMAHSLEARVPFLDHAFVELMMRIPSQIRTKPGGSQILTATGGERSVAGRATPCAQAGVRNSDGTMASWPFAPTG